MAVTIKKKSLTIASLVKRLFDGEVANDTLKLAKALEAGGYKLTTESTALKIENDHSVLSEANVKLSAIHKALKGDLTYAGKTMLKGHIEQFVKKAYNLMPDAQEKENLSGIYDATMMAYHENGGGNKVAAIKTYRTLTGASLKDAKDKVEAWLEAEKEAAGPMPDTGVSYDAESEKITITSDNGVNGPGDPVSKGYADPTAAAVDLSAATKLHQPVKGTSGGSVYHVIALGADAKVAARIKNTDVAIRVLPANNKGAAACKVAGLDEKNGGHWSIHLHPDNKLLVKKCVGAVLFAMGLKWVEMSGDLEAIVGAGK